MCIEQKFHSRGEEETEKFAFDMAAGLPRGSVVLLSGDLGAGKTVFARGFARGLGIDEPVSSPTYTIVQEYQLPGGGLLFHLDLYRIENSVSALAFGVDEFLDDPECYALVEWPERIADILPDHAIRVEISHRGENEREICVKR